MDGFRVADAVAVGMPRRRLYDGRLHRPFHGVRTDERPGTHLDLCHAATLALPPGAVISHRSAAMLHEMPLPRHAEPAAVEVCVFEPDHRPRVDGIVGHRVALNGQRVVRIDGLLVFAPEEVWVQLGDALAPDDLVVIGDYLITGSEPYDGAPPPVARAQLDDAMRRHGSRRGARALRPASPRVRYGSLSPQESRLRLALEDAGLPAPELNYRVAGDDGRVGAMIDLAYPSFGVAIEYLGDHHRLTAAAYRQDITRREWLVQRGWSVVFVTAADSFPDVARRVRAALQQAAVRT
jgi:hypothetical protein